MELLSKDHATYRTEGVGSSVLASLWPSIRFYLPFLYIVVHSSNLARNGKYDDRAWQQSSLNVLRQLESSGVQVEVEGLEHLKNSDEPVVFIGNHLSMLETVVLPSLILPYKKATFVVKQSLLDYPVFKHVMRSRNPISVTRTNPRQDLKQVLEQGQQRLADGISVIIFPQTTRTEFNPEQFSSIGVKLAKKAGAKIIPLALLTDAWGNGRLFKDLGRIEPKNKVKFRFGAPIEVKGKGTEEHQQIIEFIQQNLKRWQDERKVIANNQ